MMNHGDKLRLIRRQLQMLIKEIDDEIGPDIDSIDVVYAVGIKYGNEFGMFAGPHPDLTNMLAFYPTQEDISSGPIHLLECKRGPNGESLMKTVRVWDRINSEWRMPLPGETE